MKSTNDIDLKELTSGKSFHPSPERWEDQVLYFLMLDRFSDGNENGYRDNAGEVVENGQTPKYNPSEDYRDKGTEEWKEAGLRWNGGNLNGLESKLGYLKRMGVTAIWISPVLKQVAFEETYHGYGTQNFLDIDPHFGTKDDFVRLVKTAHKIGLYVILDIIVNHSGDVFSYRKSKPKWRKIFPHKMKGFNDKSGKPTIPSYAKAPHEKAWPDGSVWPQELQNPNTFTRRGRIQNWDRYPEYIQGDFFRLKNHYLGKGKTEHFKPSPALKTLTEVYKYWIALADIDGFRLDTVKHMWPGAVKYFVSEIHDFARSIGKENFYIIGEITGGKDLAMNIKNKTGLDAALGINEIPESLENGAKGYRNPADYFALFENTREEASKNKKWFMDEVVTMFDDHDMVSHGEEHKARFCADKTTAPLVLNALFMDLMTHGIPCIYYGTEQGFDGNGPHDRYIRESMFGGEFGAFRTGNKHFFDEENPSYRELSKILKVRSKQPALRHGRQYYRMISWDGQSMDWPHSVGEARYEGIIAWSRFHEGEEILLVINTDTENPTESYVQVDSQLHEEGSAFECLYYSYDNPPKQTCQAEKIGEELALKIQLPASGCGIFKRTPEG
mgnify:CR=1 FL=1